MIESDDWGTIRSTNKRDLDRLRRAGVKVDKCHYMLNDCLASNEDLDCLFNSLVRFQDCNGKSPIFTANVLVANPDFQKIREDSFQTYYYEHFTQTLQRYPRHDKAFQKWKDATLKNLFFPQFHGREHLNIQRWMADLKKQKMQTTLAFQLGIFGLSSNITDAKRGSYLAAFDKGEIGQPDDRANIIRDGLSTFKRTFGFPSKSFIAPNYIWDKDIETALNQEGVKMIQSNQYQYVSRHYGEPLKKVRHFLGQKNDLNQQYLIRNCFFEPSANPALDWVDKCLREIQIAFLMKKPAVISTHRVNYIGAIEPQNRAKNLKLLEALMSGITRKWPDVEFMSSVDLYSIINVVL